MFDRLILTVPHTQNRNMYKSLVIGKHNVVKILANFSKTSPIIFYYLTPSLSEKICNKLGMIKNGKYYFNSLSLFEKYRRIVIKPFSLKAGQELILKEIYETPTNILQELSLKEAIEIFKRSCPEEICDDSEIQRYIYF